MTRFAALDGLRGLSAVAVALFHLPLAFHLYPTALVREAYVFVDFFFVLSGFVIAHAYGARLTGGADLGEFLWRRIGRLWPLHLATLAALVALECVRLLLAPQFGDGVRPPFSGETALSELLPNALLLHGWGYNVLTWNIPSWSISAELFAYIVFGVVAVLARGRALLVAAILAAATWTVSLAIAANVPLYSALTSLRAVCGFFAGVLVYAAFTRRGAPRWPVPLATPLEVGATLLIAAYLIFIGREEITPWAMPIFALAVYIFAAERGLVSSLLKSGPLQLLGMLSYSIYLTHSLLITAFNAVARLIGRVTGIEVMAPASSLFPDALDRHTRGDVVNFGNAWLNDLYALAFLAAVIVLSAITYRLIEVPGQKLFAAGLARRRLDRAVTAT
jgi:peptidoglycan/LPS O-acetylase OafA/YrhL